MNLRFQRIGPSVIISQPRISDAGRRLGTSYIGLGPIIIGAMSLGEAAIHVINR